MALPKDEVSDWNDPRFPRNSVEDSRFEWHPLPAHFPHNIPAEALEGVNKSALPPLPKPRQLVKSKHFRRNSSSSQLPNELDGCDRHGDGGLSTNIHEIKDQLLNHRRETQSHSRASAVSQQTQDSHTALAGTSQTQVLYHPAILDSPKDTLGRAAPGPNQRGSALHGSQFSAPDSLSAFLKLRSKTSTAKLRTIKRESPGLKENPTESIQSNLLDHADKMRDIRPMDEVHKAKSMGVDEAISDLPTHEHLLWHRTVVVNNRLLQNNSALVRFCEHKGRGLLAVIYRDLDLLDRTPPDIILSPISCLLIANIQSFTQRPLPGQKATSGSSFVHERVGNLAESFDHVILLVTCPKFSAGDTALTTMLSAFCSTISRTKRSHVRVVYIIHNTPLELENAINAWTWASIANDAFPTFNPEESPGRIRPLCFIQDETIWERFLRQAGLNVMAAQAIPAVLKSLESNEYCSGTGLSDCSGVSSLSRFVRMDRRERLKLFSSIIGARAVESISSVLDANSID